MVHSGTPHLPEAHSGVLGTPVFFSHDIIREFIKAHHVCSYIILIIGSFGNPDISDSQLQGGIGIGQYGNPFIGMNGRGIVRSGQMKTCFIADFGPEIAAPGWGTGRQNPRAWSPGQPRYAPAFQCAG